MSALLPGGPLCLSEGTGFVTVEQEQRELRRYRTARDAGLSTILFVCTGNAVRSQLAEGLVNHFHGADWAAFSAGTMPMEVQKDVIKVMKEINIDLTDHWSKHVGLFDGCTFDRVVILCSDAGTRCPDFPYAGRKDQMNFDDPLSPELLAGGICFSYRSRIRSLRNEIQKAVAKYLKGG
ncbi:MAG: arsenate reductase [Thermodesulfovibrio sp.]|nr:arsenate reductase [Thermodesulfovibrio sp.]